MGRRKTAVAEANGEHKESTVSTDTLPEAIPLNGDQTNGVHTPPDNNQTGPPEPVNGTRPVETFSVPCGGGAYVQASVWGKQIEYEGRSITVYSVTVRKSYKDATTGEWKNTNSFRGSELYCVHHVLTCAGTWVLNQRTETSTPF